MSILKSRQTSRHKVQTEKFNCSDYRSTQLLSNSAFIFTVQKNPVPTNIKFQVNHHEHDVYIGATNKDEMCNFYVMYWVLGKESVDKRVCFSQGPPFWSWKANAQLQNIPDEAASTLP